MKNWKQCALIGMVAIIAFGFAFVGCDDGNGKGDKTYTVTIGTLKNGIITANPTSGTEGTEITLMVNPDNGYRLKAGTLKYGTTAIDETILKFNLSAENVTVTAEFESKFIGTWYGEDVILTFSEGEVIIQSLDEKYNYKGTWTIEDPNKLILTITHQAFPPVLTIDELIVMSPVDDEYLFEFTSDSRLILQVANTVNIIFIILDRLE
jgi:hypothetical protein